MRLISISLVMLSLVAGAQNTKKDKLVKIQTPFGDMTVILYDETPLHKANFIELAESGRYDSTVFHRVIKEFMIQGGDIYKKSNEKINFDVDDRIPPEFVQSLFHHKGALAAARTNNPEKKSSNCQFYIVQGKVYDKNELTIDQSKLNQTFAKLLQEGKIDSMRNALIELQKEQRFDEMNELITNSCDYLEKMSGEKLRIEISPERLESYTTIGGTPHLDDEYTVFGKVIEGLEVIDKIAAVETKRGDAPVDNVHMTMEVIELSKKKITKTYGYTYPKK